MGYDDDIYCGAILRGDLHGAMDYIKQFPECGDLHRRYVSLFEEGRCLRYDVPPALDALLTVYQRYYGDVFYRLLGKEASAEALRARLAEALGISGPAGIGEMERGPIKEAFAREGLHFLGGKTGGYYGPYVWKTAETAVWDVELPEGSRRYAVRLLDGFITRGWIDHLSFGRIGTGGWTDGDGIICCVRSSYDLDSEDFTVSLLKHEAQHALDLERDPDMASAELEYRAKLVELIYSSQRALLPRFAREAGPPDGADGHAEAARRIIDGFSEKLRVPAEALDKLPLPQVQRTARELFEEDGPKG